MSRLLVSSLPLQVWCGGNDCVTSDYNTRACEKPREEGRTGENGPVSGCVVGSSPVRSTTYNSDDVIATIEPTQQPLRRALCCQKTHRHHLEQQRRRSTNQPIQQSPLYRQDFQHWSAKVKIRLFHITPHPRSRANAVIPSTKVKTAV